jgi:hypothetical protein
MSVVLREHNKTAKQTKTIKKMLRNLSKAVPRTYTNFVARRNAGKLEHLKAANVAFFEEITFDFNFG